MKRIGRQVVLATAGMGFGCVVLGYLLLHAPMAGADVSLNWLDRADQLMPAVQQKNTIRLRLSNHSSSPARIVGTNAC